MTDLQVTTHWLTRPILRNKRAIKRLFKFLDGRGFIAGSYAAYACAPTAVKPGDIDVFATTAEHADNIVLELCNMTSESYGVYDRNDVVTTMYRPHRLNIQVIRPSPEWTDFPNDLMKSFDLDVCRAVVTSPTEVLCDENAGWIVGKVLRINNPLRTLKRIIKYAKRDVEFNDHELLKVFRAWDEMPAEKKTEWITNAADALKGEPFDSDFVDDDDWFEGE